MKSHQSSSNGTTNGTNGKAGHHDERLDALLPAPLDLGSLFDGANLVVLGGTGFLGKVFWSMLVHEYPNLGKIYLLVRSSKGKSSDARFWEDIATSACLDPLRAAHGDNFEAFIKEKIRPIDGDTGRPLCGIDAKLVQEMRGTIDAVVNVAGVVDFSPPLDEALDANAFGCQNLVALARALGDVPLMHTSTCYVAGQRPGPIYEVHPTEMPFPRANELGRHLWDPEREIAECLDLIAQARHRADDAFRQSEFEEQAKKNLLARNEPTEGRVFEEEFKKVKRRFVADRLIESGTDRAGHWGWPNIYTYTKSIGEQVIARSGLPFCIVRPACCESTIKYPFPGWNEGISTSVPMIYLGMKGQMLMPLKHVPLDFIPTDMVCAGMIISLGELLDGTAKPVYQYGSSDTNPCSAARFGELVGLYKRKHYQRTGKGNPLFNLLQAHYEVKDVELEDFERLSSPMFAKLMKGAAGLLKETGAAPLKGVAKSLESAAAREQKIADIMRIYSPFTTEVKGPFDCANTRAAYTRLAAGDRAKLPWGPESIDWFDWMHNIHLPALEKWIFPEMEKKLKRELKPLRPHTTLVTLLDQMAERHDLSVALQRFEGTGFAPITYAELRERADTLAARLADLGVGRGDRVVLTAKNDPAWPIAYLGVLCAGATCVPVDVALEMDGLRAILRESGAKVILSDRADVLAEGAKNGSGAFHATPVWDVREVTAAGEARPRPAVEVAESDVASLIYTSGTTGVPKGVMLSHANFTSLIAALAPIFPLGRGDRVLSVLPLHHTFEFTCGLLLPLSRGARVAYLDELSADRLSSALKQGRITAMVGVPALWQMLERRILGQVHAKGPVVETFFNWAGELNRLLGAKVGIDAGRILFGPVHAELGGHVRYLISGGAALPSDTYDLFSGLGLRLTEGYGLTEAAPVLTVAQPKGAPRAGHVGKPIPGVEVRIDSPDEHGVGEIIAKGPNVMLGYTDDEATKRVIDPEGWLHTGDLGKLDKKGRLQIVGRLKDVIVTTTGENVYPDDVENKLGTIPHIQEFAVVGVEGKGGRERVACLAVPESDDSIPRGERMERAMRSLRQKVGELPYGQQPAVIHLFDAPLPRTATRKVKRGEVQAILRRMIAATAPAEGAHDQNPVRQAIAAVCNRPVAEVGDHASLQGDLGFDSLMMTELLEALEARGDAIDPHALQQCRTVGDVERLAGERAKPGVTSGRGLSRTSRIEGKEKEAAPIVLPKPVQEAAKTALGRVQHAFYDQVMQANVTGRAFIPHNKNTIVVANHASHLDMGLVKYGLGSYGEGIVSLAAQDYFFESGIKRAFFENFTNLVAFDRKSSLRASLRQAADVLERGKTVLLFPEGTRSQNGDVGEFKPLVGYLALTHGIDILPVYLGGTHAALPKGAVVPLRRDLTVRIGPPLRVADMRRLTEGMTTQDAAREVAKLAQRAVQMLQQGSVLDLSRATNTELEEEPAHPLVTVFQQLEEKFVPNQVDRPVSFYFALGADDLSKWTVRVDASGCHIKNGKPEGGVADCVLKTSPEIFTKIVREAYVPGAAEFLSGQVKSNDVSLLFTFQKAFALG